MATSELFVLLKAILKLWLKATAHNSRHNFQVITKWLQSKENEKVVTEVDIEKFLENLDIGKYYPNG